MADRADVGEFEAIERFQAALVRYREEANAILAAGDAEVARTLTWLEAEQIPHWERAVREGTDAVTAAKHKYREKALFKDATGARSSALDEKKALDRAEARLEDARARQRAARQQLIKLRRDESMYKGSVGRLEQFVGGTLAEATLELRRVVDRLERYADARGSTATKPRPTSRQQSAAMPLDPAATAGMEGSVEEMIENFASELVEMLRGRTPPGRVRATASGRANPPAPLLAVPAAARSALAAHHTGERFGRYDLVTSSLADVAAGPVYLERRESSGDNDTGWHAGPVSPTTAPAACGRLTFGRLSDAAGHEWAELLSLPVGTILICDPAGRLALATDALGRVLWRDEDVT